MATDTDKIQELIRHIEYVQEACKLLGTKLIQKGEITLGRQLIQNGYRHDSSKFDGIEWDYLSGYHDNDKDKIALAVDHHNRVNKHHPQAWDGGIKAMDKLHIAEMVCDWKARSTEFGTSLVDWIEKDAKKRFKFHKGDIVYKQIMEFVNLLLNKEFEPLPEIAKD